VTERPGNGSLAGLSSDELRATIRAVLRDVLPAAVTSGSGEPVPGSPSGDTERVTLRTDADLDVFVRRLASLCEDPAQRAALREGHRRFRLPDGGGSGTAAAAPAGVVRVDRGAVTERYVKRAAAAGVRLVVGPKAVLTPLARDRARTLGVIVDKER